MKLKKDNIIYSIGHCTHSLNDFLSMLQSFNIELIADIRSFPGSRKFPQINKEVLVISLPHHNIQYVHLKDLGGRRKETPNSKNTGWRHVAFRSYADYMETVAFNDGIKELEEIAVKQRTAYMCFEAVWWRCHRSMISDYVQLNGWEVMHIMGIGKQTHHPYTAPARIVNGELNYEKN